VSLLERDVPSSVCTSARAGPSVAGRERERERGEERRTICLAMSVLATMSLNSPKLSLPSPSWSASIMAASAQLECVSRAL